MMTGFGYDSHAVQPCIPGMEEDCCNRSQFFNGAGLSNSDYYGYLGGTYQPHQQQWDNVATTSSHQPTTLAPAAAATVPRVSISDEELYQALNISPLPSQSTRTAEYTANMSPMNVHTLPTSSSDYCFPSCSSLDQSMASFETQAAMYLPPDVRSLGPSPVRETVSPTFSIHSYAPTTSTANAEEEDLEVELINTSTPQHHNNFADELDILLHSSTLDDEFRASKNTSYSQESSQNPTPSERPPYAKKLSLSSQKNSIDTSVPTTSTAQNTSTTSPLFLQTSLVPTGFTPLLTPKSDAILQRKLSEANHPPVVHTTAIRRESYPTSIIPESFIKRGLEHRVIGYKRPFLTNPVGSHETRQNPGIPSIGFDSYSQLFSDPYDNVFDLPSPVHLGSATRKTLSTERSFSKDFPVVEEEPKESYSDVEIDDQSEEIAVNVIEKLFCGPQDVLDSPKSAVEDLFQRVSQSSPKASETKPVQHPSGSHNNQMEQVERVERVDQKEAVLDDWETADDDDITERMEKLIVDVKAKATTSSRSNTQHSAPSTSEWDPGFLPHVLALHNIPDYKMKDDVVKAIESIGFSDSSVLWIERKIVLVVFENERRAKCCACNLDHDWLRFQLLKSAPKYVQDAAREHASQLAPAKRRPTNASVARRMVENVLGQKSNVSAEQRQRERKQIADAKAAKKSSVKWD